MAFKCPNCGGNKVHYVISKKKLKCDHCGELIPVRSIEELGEGMFQADGQEVRGFFDDETSTGVAPEGAELPKGDTAEEHRYGVVETAPDGSTRRMQVVSYVCRSCGAELLSSEESIVSYCSYCGSESILEGRRTEELRPRFIMPFQKSKKQCKNEYEKRTKGLCYLPDELKNPEFLEKFRGTYIPYWLYRVDFPEICDLKAVSKKRRGDMVTESTYDVTAEISGDYQGIPYDASSCFDDTISDMLMPFDKKNLVEFEPAYLAGFYADRADVPPGKYVEDVERRAAINAYDSVSEALDDSYDLKLNQVSKRRKATTIPTRASDSITALLPVWFLTWRNKDRVAYAIVNGQSGKLSADLPVDMKKFSLATLGTALAIFLALTLLVSMTAKTALGICALIALIALILFNSEAKKIRNRENHVRDKGYFVKGRDVKMPEKSREKIAKKAERKTKNSDSLKGGSRLIMIGLIYFIFVVLPILFTGISFSDISVGILAITALFLIIGLGFTISSMTILRYVSEKRMMLYALSGLLSLVIAFYIAAWNPVDDVYYYLGCVGCGAAAAILAIGLIRYYNILTTRPIPTFFDREGGNDYAE